MKRSKIISDLIYNQIDVAQAFEILDLLLENIDDKEIKNWIKLEKNGYGKEDEVPSYRIVRATIKGSYIVGNTKLNNLPLAIKPEYISEYECIPIKCGINEILQYALSEEKSENHNLMMPIHVGIAQNISMVNGQICEANAHLSIYAYTNIVGNLKSKLLEIFKELEKTYGNLDELCIKFEDKSKETQVKNVIINIITDNSTKIGDSNKITNSIIGDANEK